MASSLISLLRNNYSATGTTVTVIVDGGLVSESDRSG